MEITQLKMKKKKKNVYMKKRKKKNVYTYNMYLFIGMHDMELIPGVRTSNEAAHGVGGHGEQGQEKLRKRDRWREL